MVGYPHDVYGEAIYAFMVPMEGVAVDEAAMITQLRESIKKQIGSFAIPQRFLVSVVC